jgi:hypothetical protein
MENDPTPDLQDGDALELDDATKAMLEAIPQSQLRKLIKPYKSELTEKQIERNNKLVALNKAKWEKLREDKQKHEERQMALLSQQIKMKPKRLYVRKPQIYDASDSDDEQDYSEFFEFKKWKETKKTAAKKEPKPKPPAKSDSDDDGYIQKTKPKIEKATELIQTVNKLDNAIKSLNMGSNPYLEAMNRRR